MESLIAKEGRQERTALAGGKRGDAADGRQPQRWPVAHVQSTAWLGHGKACQGGTAEMSDFGFECAHAWHVIPVGR